MTTNQMINPIETYRDKGEGGLRNILNTLDINILRDISRKYAPDSRGYIYRCKNVEEIIEYIIRRSHSLSNKGNVFVSDKQQA